MIANAKLRTLVPAMAAMLAAAAIPAHAAIAESRLVVTLTEPFEVHGTRVESGTLSLKTVRAFTPTITLNEIWIDDHCLGLVMAERTNDPRLEAARNAVMFHRDAEGVLVLDGFAYRVAGTNERHLYQMLVPPSEATSTPASAAAHEAEDPIVWIAGAGPR